MPRKLDAFSASPTGDHAEFTALWDRARAAFPLYGNSREFGYIGTDGAFHYFQLWGQTREFKVPVSPGWQPKE